MAVLHHREAGSTTLAAGSASQTVTLTTTLSDIAKAFLVFGMQPADAAPQFGAVTGQIASTTQIQFQRSTAAASPAITIYYYVAEFTSGVTVQRGGSSLVTTMPLNVTISTVDTAKAIAIVTHRNAGNDYDRTDHVRAKITSTTNLQLDMTEGGGTAEWQVVEFTTGATVENGDFSFATSDTSVPITTTLSTTGAWLIFNYELVGTGALPAEDQYLRGRITGANQVTIDRVGIGPTITGCYYLVSFSDGTTVQEVIPAQFGTGDTQIDTTITSVTVANCIVMAAGQWGRQGKTSYVTTDDPGPATFTFELTSATNLRSTRGITGTATADVVAYVVQFSTGAVQSNAPRAMAHYRRRRVA